MSSVTPVMLPNILIGHGIEFLLELAFAVEGWGFRDLDSGVSASPISDSTIVKGLISPLLPYLQLGEIFSTVVLVHIKIYLPGFFRSVLFKLRHLACSFLSRRQPPRLRRCRTLVLDTIGHTTTFPE
jgi:hypothetical protein